MRFFLNYVSLIWAHNLHALTGILTSKTLWISHWVAHLEIVFSLLFFFFFFEQEGFSEGALQSELAIVPFVEQFKAVPRRILLRPDTSLTDIAPYDISSTRHSPNRML